MPEATGPRFNYDEEADILYVSFAPGEQATAAMELNDTPAGTDIVPMVAIASPLTTM